MAEPANATAEKAAEASGQVQGFAQKLLAAFNDLNFAETGVLAYSCTAVVVVIGLRKLQTTFFFCNSALTHLIFMRSRLPGLLVQDQESGKESQQSQEPQKSQKPQKHKPPAKKPFSTSQP